MFWHGVQLREGVYEVKGSEEKKRLLPSKQNTTVDMSELNEIGAAIISLTEFPVMLEN